MEQIDKYLKLTEIKTETVVGYPVKGNNVLLGFRKKTSWGLGLNLISGIGGKLEEGETPDEALVREFFEETKLKINEYEFMGEVIFLFPHKEKWNQRCKVYLISEWDGKEKETEDIKPIWYKKDHLPKDQLWFDNIIWLPEVLKSKKVKGIFLYDENNKVLEYEVAFE